MKKAFLFLFVALGAANQLVAQSNFTDPAKIVNTSGRDAKFLKVSNEDTRKQGDEDLALTVASSKPNAPAVLPVTSGTSASKLAAARDAEKFKLSHSVLKKFKKENFSYTSDYFKPSRQHVSDASMLSDSTYVKTFKYKAYLEAKKARLNPVGHAIGTAFAVVATTAIIAAGVYEIGQM